MRHDTQTALNLRFALLDLPLQHDETHDEDVVAPILARQREMARRLADRLPPVDQRVQAFLERYLAGSPVIPRLPARTLVLDQPGLARALSLPKDTDSFRNSLVASYRLANGVLHNPTKDRRTTAGVFHIAEGGLPIPDDKRAVPRDAWARLVDLAMSPPVEHLTLPYTSGHRDAAACFVSLMLRPLVAPEVPGHMRERRLEMRFIAPGGLVSNLDFVEGIFGNAGDPFLPENDSSLDPDGWTGHTGLVILAPHLTTVTKKELGLPHHDDATPRQRKDRMCWTDPGELYNDGTAFKACARDESGVVVTVIADNYFGYCKKEVKTQIGLSANLFGPVEEEHAGGAIAFPSYTLGQEFTEVYSDAQVSVADVLASDPEGFEVMPEGYARDLRYPDFYIVPAGASYSLIDLTVSWPGAGRTVQVPLRHDATYFSPTGYRVHMEQLSNDASRWTLIGTSSRASSFHKPSTVSGGGKSEISKAISNAFNYGTVYSADFASDMDMVEEILARDFAERFADPERRGTDHRSILGQERSVGSVIKLLNPSHNYSDEYNAWLAGVPDHVKELIFIIKRYYRPEWGDDWRSHFSVATINGRPGNVLRLDGKPIVLTMLRVGFERDGSWRLFGLRPDFAPAIKVQTQDDITVSTVAAIPEHGGPEGLSRKYVKNCENLLFQRPDDAVHRGYDAQAELDIAGPDTFLSNFEPLTRKDAKSIMEAATTFAKFTKPMQNVISHAVTSDSGPDYLVVSSESRIVDGKPTANPRYLQKRPDLAHPRDTAAADLAMHLNAHVPSTMPISVPVDVIAAGRRNNAPSEDVPALCAFNPLHYMELPELFMEFISSMTGKSPSTTGAGSEGALTKGPFNMLPAIYDLNTSFLSYALTGYDGWISSAGVIGPYMKVDHDVSLLIPEVFSRMTGAERSAQALIKDGYLEGLEDYELDGSHVHASRLGYRITEAFADKYFGRIFTHPHVVFTEDMLRPELQDQQIFIDAIHTMTATHERVAKAYFDDGTVELAIPPLRALLEIMVDGVTSTGLTLQSPEFRAMFTRERVLKSDYYAARLNSRQLEAMRSAEQGVAALSKFIQAPDNRSAVGRLRLDERLTAARDELAFVSSPEYRASLVGTTGRQARFR